MASSSGHMDETSRLALHRQQRLDTVIQSSLVLTAHLDKFEYPYASENNRLLAITKCLNILENMICKGGSLFETMLQPPPLRLQLHLLRLYILKMRLWKLKC